MKARQLEEDLRGLGLDTRNDFLDIMKLGKYKCFWNRVYLVGPYGVGKSTLAKVLVGEKIPLNREATDGIWIYMGRAGMDIEENKWEYFPKGNATFEIITNMLMSMNAETSVIPLESPPKEFIEQDCSVDNRTSDEQIYKDKTQQRLQIQLDLPLDVKHVKGDTSVAKTATNSYDIFDQSIEDVHTIDREILHREDVNQTVDKTKQAFDVGDGALCDKIDLNEDKQKTRTNIEPVPNIIAKSVKTIKNEKYNPKDQKLEDVQFTDAQKDKPNVTTHIRSTQAFKDDTSIEKINTELGKNRDQQFEDEKITEPDIEQSRVVNKSEEDTTLTPVENSIPYEQIHKQAILVVKDGKYKQKIIPIDIWDFGGQKDYYMTHQLFITSRGIFVLMFNGSVDIHKHMKDLSFLPGHFGRPTVAVYLLHWVNSVLTYCKRSDDGFPRIVFVATHKDKISEKKIERQRQILIKDIRELFNTHPGIKHLEFDPLFFISAIDKEDMEIKKLQDLLMERACQHPRWGEEMPTSWVPLELQLAQEVEKGENIISKDQLYELNSKNQTMVLTEAQIETFLNVQHSLGKLLYFDNVDLCNFIIINPAYLVEVLRSIVTEKQFWPKEEQLLVIFERLEKHGMITREHIYRLWSQKEFSQILSTKEYMIDMLLHLDILVSPFSHDLLVPVADSTGELIVPCMITRPNHTNYMRFCTNERSIILAYTFVEEVIPPAMVYRFLGSFINMWEIKIYKETRMLFSDLAVAEVDKDHDIVVQVQRNRLVVSLVHIEQKENIVPTLASSVQECLTAAIHRITEFYITLSGDARFPTTSSRSSIQLTKEPLPVRERQSMEATSADPMSHARNSFRIDFGVYCSRLFRKSASCFFPHTNVSSLKQWKCPNHKQTHNIQFLDVWFAEKSAAEFCPEICKGLGELELGQCPSDKHLRRLTNRLTVNTCREVFFTLGMTWNVWDQLREEYQNIGDSMFMAILRWKEKSTNATFLPIQNALESCNANKHLLCEVFRDIDPDVSAYDEETLNKTPSVRSLLELSNHIGNSNVHLGIELDIEMSKIQEIQYQYRNKLLDQTKEIMKIWRASRRSTIHVLIKALHRTDKSYCLQKLHFS